MAVIHCKACGRSYRYEEEGCCPSCGAYNRPPKHERVNADGTVQHMTDAAFEKRKKAHGKVCFEEKECYEEKVCYEDQARHSGQKSNRTSSRGAVTSAAFSNRPVSTLASKRKTGKRGNSVVGLIVAAIAMLISFAASNGIFSRTEEPHVMPEPPVNVVPDDVTWADARMGEPLEMEDGTVITVTSWGSNDDEINVYLEMDQQDSDHNYYAALICLDPEGMERYLTDFTVEETDMGICLEFSSDGDILEPAYLEVEERLEDETLQLLYVDLQN